MSTELKDRIREEMRHLLSRRMERDFDVVREIVLTIDGERIIIKSNRGPAS